MKPHFVILDQNALRIARATLLLCDYIFLQTRDAADNVRDTSMYHRKMRLEVIELRGGAMY